MRANPNEQPEEDIITLPLTPEELLVVMRCMVIACESERVNDADRKTAGNIKDRIARFAERQGAGWDYP